MAKKRVELDEDHKQLLHSLFMRHRRGSRNVSESLLLRDTCLDHELIYELQKQGLVERLPTYKAVRLTFQGWEWAWKNCPRGQDD